MQETIAITLPLPYKMGTVNCYLVKTAVGFVLIDTGASSRRAELESELARAGCTPGNLELLILTHGDFDHIGNAAHLCQKFGARIAMHEDDTGMAEHGDMFWNRSSGNAILRALAPILYRFPKSDRFKPHVYIEEGDGLSEHGFDAQVLSIPGHSKGSIGILTAGGNLFCGDLLTNIDRPATNSIMDNPVDCEASVERLRDFEISTVYPGHGKPFPMDSFLITYRQEGG